MLAGARVRLSTRTWAGAFRAIDAEGSGRVDARQFRAVLEKFNMVLHDADFGRFWREIAGDDGLVDYNMFLQATHDDETLGCRPRVRSAKDDRYAHRMDRLMEELRKKKPAVVTKVHPDYVASTCEDGHMGAFVGTGLCGEYERMCMARAREPRVLVRRGRRAALAGEVPHGQRQVAKMLASRAAPGERVNFDRFRKAFGGDIEHLHEGGGIDWGVCEISGESAKKLGICTREGPDVRRGRTGRKRRAPLPVPQLRGRGARATVAMVAASKPDATPASVAEAVLKATVEQAPLDRPSGFTDGSRSGAWWDGMIKELWQPKWRC
ncbi:hypothetical protein SO694_00004669 [Aureococcus anophagefferens]|uniref:EF-hand domain-containing protein n=1 Tax=Aureococcus anophagefferens TaxID=44056 RepID=A0ABR1G996_AURAN